MKADVEQAVAPLAGLTLGGPDRESNMLVLHFAARGPAPAGAEPARAAGAYTLRVYCAWRLVRGDQVLAGSGDLFTPADPDEELDTFDYEAPGATWWDARWRAYVDGLAAPPTVVSVAADALGGLRVALSDGAALEVFPNSAPAEHVESEFWRLEAAGGAAFSAGTEGAAGGPA
jgi:hypothetical protein